MVSKICVKRKRRRSRKRVLLLNHILKRSDEDIHEAVNEWCENPETAAKKYGHISKWITKDAQICIDCFKTKKNQ